MSWLSRKLDKINQDYLIPARDAILPNGAVKDFMVGLPNASGLETKVVEKSTQAYNYVDTNVVKPTVAYVKENAPKVIAAIEEKTGQLYDDASKFVKDTKDYVTSRSPMEHIEHLNDQLIKLRKEYAPDAVNAFLDKQDGPRAFADKVSKEAQALYDDASKTVAKLKEIYAEDGLTIKALDDINLKILVPFRDSLNLPPEIQTALEGAPIPSVAINEGIKKGNELLNDADKAIKDAKTYVMDGQMMKDIDGLNDKLVKLRKEYIDPIAPEGLTQLLDNAPNPSKALEIAKVKAAEFTADATAIAKDTKAIFERTDVNLTQKLDLVNARLVTYREKIKDNLPTIVTTALENGMKPSQVIAAVEKQYESVRAETARLYEEGSKYVKENAPILMDKLKKGGEYLVDQGGKLLDQGGQIIAENAPKILAGLEKGRQYIADEAGALFEKGGRVIADNAPAVLAALEKGKAYVVDQGGRLLNDAGKVVLENAPAVIAGLEKGGKYVVDQGGKLLVSEGPKLVAAVATVKPILAEATRIADPKVIIPIERAQTDLKAITAKREFDAALQDVAKIAQNMSKNGGKFAEGEKDALKKDMKVIKDYVTEQLKTEQNKDKRAALEKQLEVMGKIETEMGRSDTERLEAERLETERLENERRTQVSTEAPAQETGLAGLLKMLFALITGQPMEQQQQVATNRTQDAPNASVVPPTDKVQPPVEVVREQPAKAQVGDLKKVTDAVLKYANTNPLIKNKAAYTDRVMSFIKDDLNNATPAEITAIANRYEGKTTALKEKLTEAGKDMRSAGDKMAAGDIQGAGEDMAKAMAAVQGMSGDLKKIFAGKTEIKEVDKKELAQFSAPSVGGGDGPAKTTQV